jgi:hypothetical protein
MVGLPGAVLLRWDSCSDVFRVAKRPVYPGANGGGAVLVLDLLPVGLSFWGKPL